MLASAPNLLQMCSSFDTNKSTKGASKLRRDLINSEIANLRDLLPLPTSTRQRLSQLQLMALVCVYVRKANYFQHAFRKHDLIPHLPVTNFGFSKALNGFLMMMTQNGKLLYISENAAEYLGHSMEDLLIHGDSVYDIIEKQDHQTIQNELSRSVNNPQNAPNDTRSFLCRMNVSRNSRRQMRFGDQKVVLVQGHFVSYLPLCSRNEPVFLATCTPVAMPETRECVVQGSTNVFTSIHSMDMKLIHLDANGEFHLGYNKSQIKNLSWYDIVHWENLRDAQAKHRLITQSEQERSCILLLRLQTSSMSWIWVHVVLQVKDNNENSQQPVIVCTNQVLSDKEAAVMKANSWLYQFYSLHSKMHYAMQNSNGQTATGLESPATPTPNSSNSSASNTSPLSYEAASVSASTSGSSSAGGCTSSSSKRSAYLSNYSSPTNSVPSTGSFPASATTHQHHGHHPQSYHSAVATATVPETPAIALHPSHPNPMSYYHNHSNNSMSVNTGSSALQYPHSHFSSHHPTMPVQQYSPQAGTLPYQTTSVPNQTTTAITTIPSIPTASGQTENRVKDEPLETPTPRAKRSRGTSNNQDEEKRSKSHKKNSSSHGSCVSSNGSTNTSSTYSNTYPSNPASYHSSYHSAYHHHHSGSMFGTTGFGTTDLSMMPAYYGGSMSYHHSQLSYPHHFQGKFPFFEHGTTTAGSNSVIGSGLNYEQRSERVNTSEESGTLLSTSTYGNSPMSQLNKPSKSALYSGDLASDRRDLDKVRSPESATSDYGSMTSQSPPSSFEKTYSNSGSSEGSFDYSNSQHQSQLKNCWPNHYSHASAEKSLDSEQSSLSSSHPFSRLSSFQFWPGYSSVTPATVDLAHQDSHHYSHHYSHSQNRHLPSVASTFPVETLLPSQATSVYGHTHSNLFAPYGSNTSTSHGYESIHSKPSLVSTQRSSSTSSNTSSSSRHCSASSKIEPKPMSSSGGSGDNSTAAKLSSAISVSRAL